MTDDRTKENQINYRPDTTETTVQQDPEAGEPDRQGVQTSRITLMSYSKELPVCTEHNEACSYGMHMMLTTCPVPRASCRGFALLR